MKILFIGPLPDPVTGQSLACKVLYESLLLNHEVSLINISKSSFAQGFNSFGRAIEILKIFWLVWRQNNHADVIYFTISESLAGNIKDLLIYFICWKKLENMVIHLHGGAGMNQLLKKKNLIFYINRFFLKRIGAVVVLGDRLRGMYADLVRHDHIYSVPNFSENEFFVTDSIIREKFEKSKIIKILFLSNLLPGKGHQELLQSLSYISDDLKNSLQVDIAGGFSTKEAEYEFLKFVNTFGGIKITVHGIVKGADKKRLLQNAHLFCLPTYYPYEGQPISILEAYASGCAVMTTDHSGIFDIFTPGINGLQVLPRSPLSIAKAIQYSFLNPSELFAYAKNNFKHSHEKYRVSTHVDSLESIIKSVGKYKL